MSKTETQVEPEIALVTSEFGEVYREVKGTKKTDGWEKILKDAQATFFAAATRELERGTLARKTVDGPQDPAIWEDDVVGEWVKIAHPGWRLVDDSHDEEDRVLIEEDPALKTFAYLNHLDGMVYRRSQTQGGPSLDTERLIREDPALYHEVSTWMPSVYDMARQALVWAYDSVHNLNSETVATEEVEKFLGAQSKLDSSLRVVLDPSQWSPKQASVLQSYLVPGKVSVRLTPPREAKDSELETGEVEE